MGGAMGFPVSRRKWQRLATAATLLLVPIGLQATTAPAEAASFHEYSVAFESLNKGSDGYLGVSARYWGPDVTTASGTSCGVPFTLPVVYQPIWLIQNNPASSWLELGIGHSCDYKQYLYWGIGYNGNWSPLGTLTDNGYTTHDLKITCGKGLSTYQCYWYIDGGLRGSGQTTAVGVYDEAGIESYDSTAVFPDTYDDDLAYENASGAFAWSGTGGSTVNSGMCGRYINHTTWSEAQHDTC